MRKVLIILAAALLATGGWWIYRSGGTEAEETVGAATPAGRGGAARGANPGNRTAMTVDTAAVTRQEVVDSITVVGNLIGEATVDVVSRVRKQTSDPDVRFIHVEVFKGNDPARGYNRWMHQWGLQSEPWVFLVGRDGRIKAKFEGPVSVRELRAAVESSLVA